MPIDLEFVMEGNKVELENFGFPCQAVFET